MKFGIFIFSIVFIVRAATASALELKIPVAGKRRMTIELEVVPTPPQKDFEQYVQERPLPRNGMRKMRARNPTSSSRKISNQSHSIR
jgi:hypothetical protein